MNPIECEMTINSLPGDVKINTWCKLIPSGKLPDSRVGHTGLYYKTDHKVIIIGGATPHSLYNEVWILNLQNLTCSELEVLGTFEARYEHCAFFPIKVVSSEARQDVAKSTQTEKTCDYSGLWIFAGANTEENKNDLWELNFESQQWIQLSQTGEIPSPRTYHTTSAFLGDKFVVFSGGAKGVEAVTDSQTYQLDMLTRKWSIFPTKGQPPRSRQGHVLVAVDDKLWCHGGMSGIDLYDDLHILDSDGMWTSVDCKHQPSGRAAHGAVCHGRFIYIFGGLGNSGALNDMWRLHVDKLVWEEITMGGSVPPRRLDFTLVLIELPHNFEKAQGPSHGDSKAEQKEGETKEETGIKKSTDRTKSYVPSILLHGGMDETGHIYDDFYVMILGSGKDVVLG